jgi:hypothetical protein
MRPAVFPLALTVVVLGLSARASAYPEFQAFVTAHSGRQVNCAMCHANPDGPNGLKAGQIEALSRADLDRLMRARQAFQPGASVDSPILNAFGNHIIHTLGRTRFIGLRRHPADLAAALGNTSDLDDDGVPDAQEYLDGTDPTDSQSGAPWALFLHNVVRYRMHIFMLALATLAGLYGLSHLLQWVGATADLREADLD